MIDNNEGDDKIIAVAANDISVAHINSITELPKHFIEELKNFFEEYKKLEKKTVLVQDFQDKSIAIQIIQKAIEEYQRVFKKG
jgi:inorganic pyrophosphatase